MAYTVLARRYRSSTFDQVVGQDHVAQTLKKAIASDRVAHAFLFCGTRGVGKTSMARILAKALNCAKFDKPTTEPCLECNSCKAIARGEDIDVVEIDAASNTQVEKTREVILDNAQYRPAHSRFKIYIIDEVHMLSKSSFNALLKTLEEPPEHVKFILATTEPEKVLPTILSRCQRYDFRNIPTREIAQHLRRICQDEKINAQEDALLLVAKAGAGSMRDSLSLLDRLLSIGEKELTVATVEQLLGLPKAQLIFDLVQAIGQGRVKDVLTQADRMIQEGMSPDGLIASLLDHLRNLLILRTCGPESQLVEATSVALGDLAGQAQAFEAVTLSQDIAILEDLRWQLRQSSAGRALLDATLVRLALAEQFTPIAELLTRLDNASSPSGAPVAQKKKSELEALGTGMPPATARTAVSSSTGVSPVPTGTPNASPAVPSSTGVSPVPTGTPNASPAVPSSTGVWPVPLEPAASPDSPDDNDALPGVGKVWEGGGASSLSAAFARYKPQSPAPRATPAATEPSNIAPVSESDVPAVWRTLLSRIRQQSSALHSIVSCGQFRGIIDDQAVIHFAPTHQTFAKMLARNGKKEQLCEAFSQVVGRNVGVRLEIDTAAEATDPGDGAAPLEEAGQPVSGAAFADRLTPEQRLEFENDPLIGAMVRELGATILKMSEE